MSFLDSLGASNLSGVFSGFSSGSTLLIVALMIIVAVIVGIFVFIYYKNKYTKVAFKYKIPIFLDIAGKINRIGIDDAKELFIPDSNISLYYLKNRKIYLARPTRAMGKDEFWYKILENGEWVNFELSSHPKDNTLSIADYDHRDTRYAYVNLKDIIKRNYKDKSTQWWKEYSGVITIVVVAIMFIGAMWFFFWRTGTMLEQMKPIADAMSSASDKIVEATKNIQNLNSGIIPAK